jgi:hypothetical protein
MIMEKISNRTNNYEEQILLIDILKKLIESKKVVIATTLFFMILAAVYSFQFNNKYQSNLIMEVTQSRINGLTKHIETANELTRGILDSIEYQKDIILPNPIQIKSPVGDKIILITSTSKSIENNILSLNQIAEYIKERHKKLHNKLINQLVYSISRLDTEIEYIIKSEISVLNIMFKSLNVKISSLNKSIDKDSGILNLIESNSKFMEEKAIHYSSINQNIFTNKITLHSYEFDRQQIENKLITLNNYLKGVEILTSIDFKNASNISQLIKEKNELENELTFATNQSQNNTHKIREIETEKVTNHPATIFLGFLVGLFTSIILVFGNDALRAIKSDA